MKCAFSLYEPKLFEIKLTDKDANAFMHFNNLISRI